MKSESETFVHTEVASQHRKKILSVVALFYFKGCFNQVFLLFLYDREKKTLFKLESEGETKVRSCLSYLKAHYLVSTV